jgi:cellulose synthase/poly-beta-1,6-N-acetylglucosamine synthase-like glycosyltransferase
LTAGAFLGTNFWTRGLFCAASIIVISDFIATLFTIFYQRYWYEHRVRPRFGSSFNPKCSVIVPCKGVPKDFGKNLEGFLALEYAPYEVIYVVESENDSAVPTIRSILEKSTQAKLVVAGLAKMCAQKNHNLLAALKNADGPDVFVFADSDIHPGKYWLRELVAPLAEPKITVTTGFRWLHAVKGSVGEMTHSYVNIFMYVLFSVACFFGGVGLWGGSMAIRRKDFEGLGVADRWARAAVDDMCLSQIVLKNGKKAMLVPLCITHTDDLLQTVRGTISWFQRQIMFLKTYQRAIWLFLALPVALSCGALLFLLPFAFIASLFHFHSFLEMGGGAALVLYIGELITVSLYPLLGKMPRFYKFLFLFPMTRLTHVVSYLLTYSTNTISWAGIKYHLTFNGDVAWLERPGESE